MEQAGKPRRAEKTASNLITQRVASPVLPRPALENGWSVEAKEEKHAELYRVHVVIDIAKVHDAHDYQSL